MGKISLDNVTELLKKYFDYLILISLLTWSSYTWFLTIYYPLNLIKLPCFLMSLDFIVSFFSSILENSIFLKLGLDKNVKLIAAVILTFVVYLTIYHFIRNLFSRITSKKIKVITILFFCFFLISFSLLIIIVCGIQTGGI